MHRKSGNQLEQDEVVPEAVLVVALAEVPPEVEEHRGAEAVLVVVEVPPEVVEASQVAEVRHEVRHEVAVDTKEWSSRPLQCS